MKSYKKYAFLIVFLCAISLASSACISAADNANDTSIDTGVGDATVLDTQESTSADDGDMAADAADNKKFADTTESTDKNKKKQMIIKKILQTTILPATRKQQLKQIRQLLKKHQHKQQPTIIKQ